MMGEQTDSGPSGPAIPAICSSQLIFQNTKHSLHPFVRNSTFVSKMRQLLSPFWRSLFGSLFSLLTAVGLLGNFLVIVAILGDRKMRKSVMNLLLLNLAIADALNLVTTSVEWTPTIALGHPVWLPWLPACLCPAARYLECVFLFTSILTQLTVCVERYIAIVFPIHARRLCSRANISLTIAAIWLGVSLIALPYGLHNQKPPNSSVCVNVHAASQFWLHYKWVEFLTLYLFPCLIFLLLYTKICTVLWAKNRQLYEETKSLREGSLTDPSANVSRAGSSAGLLSAREEALKTRRNVVKMLVACVSVYFICYSPIQAIFLSRGLLQVRIHPPYEFILLMNALAMLCSACNPLLYTLFSKRFRVRIARLLCCCQPIGLTNSIGGGGRMCSSGAGTNPLLCSNKQQKQQQPKGENGNMKRRISILQSKNGLPLMNGGRQKQAQEAMEEGDEVARWSCSLADLQLLQPDRSTMSTCVSSSG